MQSTCNNVTFGLALRSAAPPGFCGVCVNTVNKEGGDWGWGGGGGRIQRSEPHVAVDLIIGGVGVGPLAGHKVWDPVEAILRS